MHAAFTWRVRAVDKGHPNIPRAFREPDHAAARDDGNDLFGRQKRSPQARAGRIAGPWPPAAERRPVRAYP